MKKVQFLLSLLLACFLMRGLAQQSYFPTSRDSVEWHYYTSPTLYYTGPPCGYTRDKNEVTLVLGKDTIMNGQQWTEVGEGRLDSIRHLIGWIRYDGPKIWSRRYCAKGKVGEGNCKYIEFQTDVLIYDFSAQAGDTLSLFGRQKNVVVKKRETDGTLHLEALDIPYTGPPSFTFYNVYIWKPGFGEITNPFHFFMGYYPFCFSLEGNLNVSHMWFSCLVRKGKMTYFDGHAYFNSVCKSFLTNTSSQETDNSFRIERNPIPIGQPIQILTEDKQATPVRLALYDLSGRLLDQQVVTGGQRLTFFTQTTVSPGMYILQCRRADGYSQQEKVLFIR